MGAVEDEQSNMDVVSGARTEVSPHKGNTVQKLVRKFWQGQLSREDFASKLPSDMWAALKDVDSEEAMCRIAKTCTNRARKLLRTDREQQRAQQRGSAGQGVLSKYGLLAAPTRDIEASERRCIDWSAVPKEISPEHNSEVLRNCFKRRQWSLVAGELKILRQRRLKIECLVGLTFACLDFRREAGLPCDRVLVVGDSAELALVLAWEVHQHGGGESIVCLEQDAEVFQRIASRAHSSGLPSGALRIVQKGLIGCKEPFDLIVALAAPGGLTDTAISQCLPNTFGSDDAVPPHSQASFILLTTQVWQLHVECGFDMPPAGGSAIETSAEFIALCSLAGSSHSREANMAARIINSDRVALCRRAGIWAELRSVPGFPLSEGLILSSVPASLSASDIQALHLPVKHLGDTEVVKNTFRIVTISDTHGRHDSIHIPSADLLVVCGDFTRAGTEEEIYDFVTWLQKQPCKHKIVVAGNHDITLDEEYFLREGYRFQKHTGDQNLDGICKRSRALLTECEGVTYLENQMCTVGPLRVWGSPCQGHYFSGHSMKAFTLPKGVEAAPWEDIPAGIDIVVTHGPPLGIGDLSGETEGPTPKRAGCALLRREIQRSHPCLHLFGHIHEGYGAYRDRAGTTYVNASSCTERYLPTRLPIVIDLHLSSSSAQKEACSPMVQPPSLCLAQRELATTKESELLATVAASPAGGPSTYGVQKPDIASPLSFFARLVRELHRHPKLYDRSGTSSYRNKADYLLGSGFPGENPMCEPALNRIALRLQQYALEAECAQSLERWVECGLKLTRSGCIGIKLILRALDGSDLSLKYSAECLVTPAWLSALLLEFPEVASVTIQPCPAGSDCAKPVRSPWMPGYVHPLAFYGPPYVIEHAPLADAEEKGVTFRLSPDSFSEVNSPAEDVMFARVADWVRPWRALCPRLALLGRNGGFYGLALQRAFQFDEITWCTHCPETLADTQSSILKHSERSWLLGGASIFKAKQVQKPGFAAEIRSLSNGSPTIVHVTNSRHGLAQGIIRALLETRAVRVVVYNSCNQQPLAAEWSELCVSDGFEITKFASSDLLAGTEFESSVFLLCRRQRILVLPIGPPASGKTLLWQMVNSMDTEDTKAVPQILNVFERDRVYASHRVHFGGLRSAKARTHEEMLEMLANGAKQSSACMYIDSTNGQREARKTYRAAFKPARVIYCLLGFTNPSDFLLDIDIVLNRVLARHSRTNLPSHEKRQWEDVVHSSLRPKLQRMLQSMQPLTPEELEDSSSIVLSSEALFGPGSGVSNGGIVWRLFLEMCCPALLEAQRLPMESSIPPSLKTVVHKPRIALCFLTSALRAPAPNAPNPKAVDSALWNEAAWRWLAEDFEKTHQTPLESMFSLFRHDDSVSESLCAKGFLSRAIMVPPITTARATLSLVLAELRLLRAALHDGCGTVLMLSGSCLPLVRLSYLHQILAGLAGSVLQYHFMRGGQQRSLGVPYGSLQWKVWHQREAEVLAAVSEEAICGRWMPLEDSMARQNLAADEVVLVNELFERGGTLEATCERRPITYTEWDVKAPGTDGPVHARTFETVPEAAWLAIEKGTLLCRKVCLRNDVAFDAWREKLLKEEQS